MKETIEIICLSCGNIFKVESNGHSLAMYDKDQSIRDGDKNLKCPGCEDERLIFKGYKYINQEERP